MKLNLATDDELILELRKSSEASIAEIYRRYWNPLLAIAVNHLKDTEASEDLVQNLIIRLWDRRETIEIKNLSAYLSTSIKYSVFSALRSNRKFSPLNELTVNDENDQQEQAEKIYALFLSDYINGVAEKLPERCRLVFQFSRNQGHSIREISTKMEISEKTVEAHLSKALKVIRNSLRNGGVMKMLYITILTKIRRYFTTINVPCGN